MKNYNDLFKLSSKMFYLLFASLLVIQITLVNYVLNMLEKYGDAKFLNYVIFEKEISYWISISIPVILTVVISTMRERVKSVLTKSLNTTFNNFDSASKNIKTLKSELNNYILAIKDDHIKNGHEFTSVHLKEYINQFEKDNKEQFEKIYLDNKLEWNNYNVFLDEVYRPLKEGYTT